MHASTCYFKSGGNIGVALENFLAKYPEDASKSRSSTKKFIKRWSELVESRGSVADLQRSGRPPLIPDLMAEECASIMLNGYIDESGQQMYWASVRLACTENAHMRQVLKDHDITPKQLLLRMHAVQPDLEYLNLYVKKPLQNQRHDAQVLRLQAAIHLINLPEHMFKRTFWLDAASFCVTPELKVKVWSSRDAANEGKLMRTDPHLALAANKMVYIKYYACVNWLKGPVAVSFVTGTTGIPKSYMVSVTTQMTCSAQSDPCAL